MIKYTVLILLLQIGMHAWVCIETSITSVPDLKSRLFAQTRSYSTELKR